MFLFHKVPQILLMPLSGGTLSFSEERYMLLILEENVLNPEMEESWNGIISTMLRTEINLENQVLSSSQFQGSFYNSTNTEQVNKLTSIFSLMYLLLALMSEEIMTKPNLAPSFICYHLTPPSAYRNQLTIQNPFQGTSLVAQWLRIHLPMHQTRVRALAQKDPTCCGATKTVCHNY